MPNRNTQKKREIIKNLFKMAKSNDFFVPFFSRYSYLAVTFKLAVTSLLKKSN